MSENIGWVGGLWRAGEGVGRVRDGMWCRFWAVLLEGVILPGEKDRRVAEKRAEARSQSRRKVMEIWAIVAAVILTSAASFLGLVLLPGSYLLCRCVPPSLLPSGAGAFSHAVAAGVLMAVVSFHMLPEFIETLQEYEVTNFVGVAMLLTVLVVLAAVRMLLAPKEKGPALSKEVSAVNYSEEEKGEDVDDEPVTVPCLSSFQPILALTFGLASHEVMFGIAMMTATDLIAFLMLILSVCLHKVPVGVAVYATVEKGFLSLHESWHRIVYLFVGGTCMIIFVFANSVGLGIGLFIHTLLALFTYHDILEALIGCVASAFVLDVVYSHLLLPSLKSSPYPTPIWAAFLVSAILMGALMTALEMMPDFLP